MKLFIATLFLASVSFAQSNVSVDQAYKKELIFLQSQKVELQKRFADLHKQDEMKNGKAKKELAQLQAKLVNLNSTNEALTLELADWERNAEGADDSKSLYDTTIGQATYTLKSRLKVEELSAKNLDELFKLGLEELAKSTQVRIESKKKFFLTTGKSVEGDILFVGDIARFGKNDQQWFSLSPVGSGDFKAQNLIDSTLLQSALDSKNIVSLPLWLYESADLAQEKKEAKGVIEYIHSGGLIAWVIVGIGLFALLLTIIRALLLKKASKSTQEVGDEIRSLVEAGKMDGALEVAAKAQGAVGRVMFSTVHNIERSKEELEDIIAENIIHESKPLDRFGTMIMVFASVAPLFGLLGTVTGMIDTFDIITEYGSGDPKMLSSGISEALITTEFGLIVAIPSLLLGNMLTGWSDGIKLEMEKSALKITNAFLKFKHTSGK